MFPLLQLESAVTRSPFQSAIAAVNTAAAGPTPLSDKASESKQDRNKGADYEFASNSNYAGTYFHGALLSVARPGPGEPKSI